eukprot:COSAG01_NODE_56799_length_316_cov_0.714286_1_plen_21_part_10
MHVVAGRCVRAGVSSQVLQLV